jgi:flagellar basal body rod protein FlgC
MQLWLSLQPERVHDPEDPNADEDGTVWIISVLLQEDADKLYVCTDGCIR